MAPYADLTQLPPGKLFVPGQTGPHIYSDDGVLPSGFARIGHKHANAFVDSYLEWLATLPYPTSGRFPIDKLPREASVVFYRLKSMALRG